MARIRHDYANNFTIIDNHLVLDPALSYKARGLFLYLWSLPDDWNISLRDIQAHSFNDGQGSVRSGIAELQKNGYLSFQRVHAPDGGKFIDTEWTLTDVPCLKKPKMVEPKMDNSNTPKYYKETSTEKISIKEISPQTPLRTNQQSSPDVLTVLNHLNAITNRSYQVTKHIAARLKDGYSVEDCRLVLDWLHIERRRTEVDWVEKYLDHTTPFRPDNFDKYLQRAKEWNRNNREPSTPTNRRSATYGLTDKEYNTVANAMELSQELLHDQGGCPPLPEIAR